MTPQQFAALLAGATYRNVITKEQAALAKQHGLVVVYGQSDDLMEFDGAIRDELGACDGTTAYLTAAGLVQSECGAGDDCPHYKEQQDAADTIDALWASEGDYSWTYRTEIPHATFEIIEDGEPYCRGIVFALADVGREPAADSAEINPVEIIDAEFQKCHAAEANPRDVDVLLEALNNTLAKHGFKVCVSTKTRRALQSAPAPAAQADERSYDMALERLVLARQFMPADKQDAFDQAWDKRRSELRATRQQSAPTAECTCPSGNGSLRYPCPAHSADAASEADKIDYSLARGDTVYSPYWGEGTRPVEVVDVNWALRAAAVRLAPKGGIVVWPVSHLQRERQQGADRG